VFGYTFDEDDSERRWDTVVYRDERDAPQPLGAFSGQVDTARVLLQQYDFGPRIDAVTAGMRLEWMPFTAQRIDFLVAASRADNQEDVVQRRFQAGFTPELSYQYDIVDRLPSVRFDNPDWYGDPGNYLAVLRRHWEDSNRQDSIESKLAWSFAGDGALSSAAGLS